MTRTKKVTISLLVAAVLALIAWDVVVAMNPTPGDTISEITLAFAMRHPALPFAVGVVCGHLFWPQYRRKE